MILFHSLKGFNLCFSSRFPTRDGTLLPNRGLPLSGPLAKPHNIPILIGTNRDEASYIFPLGSTNFTDNLVKISASLGVSLIALANSSFAPDQSASWPTLTDTEKAVAVFNATGHIITAGAFTCLTTASLYSASKNRVFNPVYQFQFNRTYQPARFTDSARAICGRDVDNPETQEYYKCHAGEVPFTFGNILSQGWRDRDGLDTPFARLIVDYWTGFARTGKMMPEKGFLEARGFTESEAKIKGAGIWGPVDESVMRLQWGGLGMATLDDEQTGCRELGLAKDFYEGVDFGVGS